MNRLVGGVCCAAVAFLLASADVRAGTLIDRGDTTFDPVSGLAWLDVNLTAGLSYNDVSAMLGAGQTYSGYRYATGAEVDALVTAAGAIPGVFASFPMPALGTLNALLGPTSSHETGTSVFGLIGEGPEAGLYYAALLLFAEFIPGTIDADANGAMAPFGLFADDFFRADLGHFLVREEPIPLSGTVIENPLPGALPLFAGGLGVLAWLARRRLTRPA